MTRRERRQGNGREGKRERDFAPNGQGVRQNGYSTSLCRTRKTEKEEGKENDLLPTSSACTRLSSTPNVLDAAICGHAKPRTVSLWTAISPLES